MSEEDTQEQQPEGSTEGGNDSGFTPPASQEELNRIIEKRLERERSKFGDYDDLKAKAAQLDEIEAANQTEAEKQAAKLAEAEKAAAQATAEALRYRIAAKFKVSDEDAELFLTGTDEETVTKQAERLVARNQDQSKTGLHVAREGGNGGGASSTADLFAAAIKDQL